MRSLSALLLSLLLLTLHAPAQTGSTVYHESAPRINDLVHTKLAVNFDFPRARMNGEAWITLQPHFYATDSLTLDAKGMAIDEVALYTAGKNTKLAYTYDSMNLRISLGRSYKAGQPYTVYIRYVARPNEYAAHAYSLMAGEKGLYFINPRGEEKGKPTQVWTQGETEANSYWMPTIDKPNQKMTDEIAMTVPAKYQTLSNGLLKSSKANSDGTRTDNWSMDQPHAPYLVFMGVGEYAVIKDQYKGKEVSYYVEPEYAPLARRIFGGTPDMIALFSRLTGVDYPWPKYAQITGRDYIFGAMENTSATLHEESSQQDARELSDGNAWESVIVHELFHQWFGDYVTTESWSNTTLNESFADYSESLWNEYKYGKESMQQQIYSDRLNYLSNPTLRSKKLVSFNYANVFEMFDQVSYQKGGCILHMLRNYVGDSAFFKSLNLYLTSNKYKSAEAQQLRLAFEEVTGKDLSWFWNQWYYGSGHPVLDISYGYDAAARRSSVIVAQTQEGAPFTAPVAVNLLTGNSKTRHAIWLRNRIDTFYFASQAKPDLVLFDADNVLLAEKTDHKTAAEWTLQYAKGCYIERREAVDWFLNHKWETSRFSFFANAVKEPNAQLRRHVLQNVNISNDTMQRSLATQLEVIAVKDAYRPARAEAIEDLGYFKNSKYRPLFLAALKDSSYYVAGKALAALAKIDSVEALAQARLLAKAPARKLLQTTIADLLSRWGSEGDFAFIYNAFDRGSLNTRFELLASLATAITRDSNDASARAGVEKIIRFRGDIPEFFGEETLGMVNAVLAGIAEKKPGELGSFIRSKLPAAH